MTPCILNLISHILLLVPSFGQISSILRSTASHTKVSVFQKNRFSFRSFCEKSPQIFFFSQLFNFLIHFMKMLLNNWTLAKGHKREMHSVCWQRDKLFATNFDRPFRAELHSSAQWNIQQNWLELPKQEFQLFWGQNMQQIN